MKSANGCSSSEAGTMNLDGVLNQLGGFGLYQVLSLCLLMLASACAAFPFAEFVFAAKDVHTRCFIPECESWRDLDWEPEWLNMTVPSIETGFDQCNRFKPAFELGICYEEFFTNETIPCQSFVHATRDTIVYDFELECNEWPRVLIGISHGLAALVFQPFAWFLSDRVGRSSIVTACTVSSTLMSLIRATSVNYYMYIVFYLTSSTLSGGALTASYILATDIVGSKWRPIAAAVVGIGFALGQSLFGLIVWFVEGWRLQLLIAYGPHILVATYLWLLPESVAWILQRGKTIAAEKALKQIARTNCKKLPTKDIVSSIERYQKRQSCAADEFSSFNLVIRIWKMLTVSVWWITCALIFFSMTINADVLTDDVYLNFIIVCLVEIPSHIIMVPCVLLFGRKLTLILAFGICAGTSLSLPFIPTDPAFLYLMMYLIAKGSISAAFTCVIVLTLDIVPTNCKTGLMAYATTVGRIGGLLAMFSPLAVIVDSGVPPFLFGGLAAASAVLAILEKIIQRKSMRIYY